MSDLSSFDFKTVKTVADVKTIPKIVVDAKNLSKIFNKSNHSLKGYKFLSDIYFGKNFSFCDFDNADIRGCIFNRCNFSFSVNLDKTITDDKTKFHECNLSGADLPDTKLLDKCNTKRYDDTEITNFFKESF